MSHSNQIIQHVAGGNDDLISSLSADVLLEIALKLPYSQVLRLCRVSRTFNQLFCVENYGHLWQTLYRRDVSKVRVPENVTPITESRILQEFDQIPFHKTRFIEAIRRGYEVLAQQYLNSINPAGRDRIINEALEWATQPGYYDLYNWLMSLQPKSLSYALKGAVLNHRDDLINQLIPKLNRHLNSGIFNAAKTGQIDLLNRFLGINSGMNALSLAIRGAAAGNQRDLLESLLNRFPNPNDPQLLAGALYGAARGDHRDLVEELLVRGANPYTAFTGAAVGGHLDLLEDLFERELNQGQPERLYANILIGAAEGGHLNVINYMLDLINFAPEVIDAALTEAAQKGHLEIVRRLLDENPNDIHTAIVSATVHGYPEIADYLNVHDPWIQQHPQSQPQLE